MTDDTDEEDCEENDTEEVELDGQTIKSGPGITPNISDI